MTDPQATLSTCPNCNSLFAVKPQRPHQDFCGPKCRTNYHVDVGTRGVISGVSRLKRGVRVMLYFKSGTDAEHAIQLKRGDAVRTVKI